MISVSPVGEITASRDLSGELELSLPSGVTLSQNIYALFFVSAARGGMTVLFETQVAEKYDGYLPTTILPSLPLTSAGLRMLRRRMLPSRQNCRLSINLFLRTLDSGFFFSKECLWKS